MEAKSKRKRIAHSHLSNSSFGDHQKLPPDDFVYNIMKDMNSKDIMSYQLSQETKSKERQDLSRNNQKSEDSAKLNRYCKKQNKKILPKKSFPLMQQCQKSLKYLHKNRCVPKPRAHVGKNSNPPKQFVTSSEPNTSRSNTVKNSTHIKRTKVQSKAYSQVIESTKMRASTWINKKEEKPKDNESVMHQADSYIDYSSSDDADTAYENFIKESKEENKVTTDSDSDSRLTIYRKKNKLKRKKKQQQSAASVKSKQVFKVNSIPLSDSSESQSESSVEVNERSKRRKVSPSQSLTQSCTDPLESNHSDSSVDQITYLNSNNCSSDELSSESAPDFGTASMSSVEVENNKTLDLKLRSTLLDNQTSELNLISVPFDLKTKANQPMVDKNEKVSRNCNSTDSIDLETFRIPCFVKIKRDPNLDLKARSCSLTTNNSAIDCITISDESDDEVSPSFIMSSKNSPFISSHIDNMPVKNSHSPSDFTNNANADDCMLQSDLPKVASLSAELTNCCVKPMSTDLCGQYDNPIIDSVGSPALSKINCNPNFDDIATLNSGDTHSNNSEKFNVQIIAVKSLFEQSAGSTIDKTGEANQIEVVDLSDDDSNLQENTFSNINLAAENQVNAELLSKEEIHGQNNTIPCLPNIQNLESNAPLSVQNSSEELSIQLPIISNSKILETLNKIDFDSIKEIIKKTTLPEAHPSSIIKATQTYNEQNTRTYPTNIYSANVTQSEVTVDATMNSKQTQEIKVGGKALLDAFESKSQANETLESHITDFDDGKQIRGNLKNINAKSPIAKNSPLHSVEVIQGPKTSINKYASQTICDGSLNEMKAPIIEKPEYEIFKGPSEELDVISTTFTKDLNTPNTKVDALLNLYKSEYAKYMTIVNTEANVTKGLKMLHCKQLEKLNQLRSSIKSIVKKDPCYQTLVQQKSVSKDQACIKEKVELKNISVPNSSSEKGDNSINVKMAEEELNSTVQIASSERIKSEILPYTTTKLDTEVVNSEDSQRNENQAKSEVHIKPSDIPTAKRFQKFMKDIKCAECGKPAAARCQGCAQVYYCSSECGILAWKTGHNLVCRRN